MTEREKLAYVAGMLDGDGSIQIHGHVDHYYVRLTISNSSEKLMDWLAQEFGGYRQSYKRAKARNIEHSWSIQDSKKAIAFIEQIFPFLIVKKIHAIIVLNFANKEWHDNGKTYFEQLRDIQVRRRSQ